MSAHLVLLVGPVQMQGLKYHPYGAKRDGIVRLVQQVMNQLMWGSLTARTTVARALLMVTWAVNVRSEVIVQMDLPRRRCVMLERSAHLQG